MTLLLRIDDREITMGLAISGERQWVLNTLGSCNDI